MQQTQKKALNFSFLDMFILILLAFCAYFLLSQSLSDKAQEEEDVLFDVQLTASLPYEELCGLCEKGQKLYDKSGKEVGRITDCREMKVEGSNYLLLNCQMSSPPKEGEVQEWSTRSLTAKFVVSSVEEKTNEGDTIQEEGT